MAESINGIRIIKYFGWEEMVIKQLANIRRVESYFIYKLSILRGFIELLTRVTP
jgi:hypothetical protein